MTMGVTEIALAVLACLWPLLRMAGWHRIRTIATAYVILAVVVLTLMLLVGAGRWPLAPAILLVLLWEVQASAVMVGDIPPPGDSRWPLVIYGMALVVLAVPAGLLALVVLPRVPPIVGTGPFMVGVRDVVIADSTGADSLAGRQVPVRLWFPGEPESDLRPLGPPDSVEVLEAALAEQLFGRPWGRVVRGVTRARVGASTPMRLSSSRRDFPVVILARPDGNPILFRRLAVHLASHGFLVAEPVGQERGLGSLPWAADASGAPGGPADVGAAESLVAGLRALGTPGSGDRLAGRLQLEQFGWVGVGPAVRTGRQLAAVGTVAALVAIGAAGPSSGELDAPPELLLEELGAPTIAGGATIRTAMPGAQPIDFTDLAWWSPFLLRRAGSGGFVPAARMEAWIQGWTTAFLGVHLAAVPGDSLRALASRFPGTTVSLP